MAKGKKTGGRAPGSKNKSTVALRAAVIKQLAGNAGLTPYDYYMKILNKRKPARRKKDSDEEYMARIHHWEEAR